jgi:hypothetical protein
MLSINFWWCTGKGEASRQELGDWGIIIRLKSATAAFCRTNPNFSRLRNGLDSGRRSAVRLKIVQGWLKARQAVMRLVARAVAS